MLESGAEAWDVDELRARRRTLMAAGEALQRRLAAECDAALAARADAAVQRDQAASILAECRVLGDELRAQTGRAVPSPIRVLVVDDLAPLRRLVARQLTRAGHTVVGEAGTAAEAVARARTLAPDVVLLDLHLPDGLGTEVAARLTEAGGRRAPAVLFYTGDAAAAHAAGAAPGVVLEKPAPAAELDQAVRGAAAARAHAGRVAASPS